MKVKRKRTRAKMKVRRINEKLEKAVRFAIIFNVSLFLFFVSEYMLSDLLFFLQDTTAELVKDMLLLNGVDAELRGLIIIIPVVGGSFAGVIDLACTGWRAIMIFLSLVIATPVKNKRTALVFVPVLYLVNLLRAYSVFYAVSTSGVSAFGFVHKFLWTWLMIFFVFVLWVLWFKWSSVKD